jgi:hypothetical protein
LAAAGIPAHHRPRAVTVTLAAAADLPPATDPTRTLVTETDDPALVLPADPTIPSAVIPSTPPVVVIGAVARP